MITKNITSIDRLPSTVLSMLHVLKRATYAIDIFSNGITEITLMKRVQTVCS